MKQLIIDRSKWRTGGSAYDETHGYTQLLNEKGNMCCLGFYCLQIGGIHKKDIYENAQPDELNSAAIIHNDEMLHLVVDEEHLMNSYFTSRAIVINDDEELTNEEREIFIQEHFKQIDVEVVFTNDYKQ